MTRMKWLIGGLSLLGFVVLGAGLHLVSGRARIVPDRELLGELAEAEFLESPPTLADSWPGWLGPSRDGVVSFPQLNRKWQSGPALRHKLPGGDGYSSFAVRGKWAWTLIADDNREVVVCLDLNLGSEKWRRPYLLQQTFDYSGPRSTPLLVDNDLFAVLSDGQVIAIDAETGAERWVSRLKATPPRWGFAHSPLLVGNKLFIGPAVFDRADGRETWNLSDVQPGYSSPVRAVISGVEQVIWFNGTHLVGVQPKRDSYEELWRFRWDTFSNVNAATPLVIPARQEMRDLAYVFISSGYGKGCAVVRVTREGGTFTARPVYESSDLCCHFASPVRRGEYVYGLDETRDLTCMNLRTGQIAWRQRGFRKGSLIRVDDCLLILGENGNLALAEATPESYRPIAMARPFRDRCWSLPALADGVLMLRDRKTIQIFEMAKGSD